MTQCPTLLTYTQPHNTDVLSYASDLHTDLHTVTKYDTVSDASDLHTATQQ